MLTVLFATTVLVWLAYEIVQIVRRKPTVSEQVWTLSRSYPPFVFLVSISLGILLGHLFFAASCAYTPK